MKARIELIQNVYAAADTAPAEVRDALVELLELGKGNPEDDAEAWEAAEARLQEALRNLDELIAIQQEHEATGDVPFR